MIAKNTRLRFVVTLSVLATGYGGILAFRLLHHETDALSDILKMCGLIFAGTLILSTIWWSIITPKLRGPWGGAIAALLTGICIIPVPTFLGGFKSTLSTKPNILDAAYASLHYSLSTLSTAEFIALPLCFTTGYFLTRDA